MYIISIDLGSTNSKAIILTVKENDKEGNIEIVGKVKTVTTDFALFIYKVLEEYKIKNDDVEVIVATGTGSSFIGENFDGIKVIKVDEFNAIAYGGLILAGETSGYVVSIGTGTTIVYSDMEKVERVGGTGLGGGTLVGLGNAILLNMDSEERNITNFKTLIDMAKKGNRENVDLMIGDINKGSIGDMTSDITAANFAAINKKASKCDYVAASVNLILENISLIVKALCKKSPIIYIGTMVTDEFIQGRLTEIAEYTKNEITFVNESEYAIAIGAWEYYLLNIRKNY